MVAVARYNDKKRPTVVRDFSANGGKIQGLLVDQWRFKTKKRKSTVARDKSADSGIKHKKKSNKMPTEARYYSANGGKIQGWLVDQLQFKKSQWWQEITRPIAAQNKLSNEMPTVARYNSADGGTTQKKR